MVDLSGQTINARYEIQNCIGKGGMGVVYAANDLALNRDIAIKFVSNNQLESEGHRFGRRPEPDWQHLFH